MRYCNACHKTREDQHFIDRPDHAARTSKRPPADDEETAAPERQMQPRATRATRAEATQATQGDQGEGLPVGLLLVVGIGLLGALIWGAISIYRENHPRPAKQDEQGEQSGGQPA